MSVYMVAAGSRINHENREGAWEEGPFSCDGPELALPLEPSNALIVWRHKGAASMSLLLPTFAKGP